MTELELNSEICRVCRSEGTLDQPLFYPCLCSGSIKYIHQDCLVEWLKHSKKRYCELCKHPFIFSPVYAEQMPQKIPLTVLIFGIVRKLFGGCRLGLSWSFAALLWFLAVPIVSSQIFSYYFGWNIQNLFDFTTTKDQINDEYLDMALSILFDAIQGFLLTGMTVILILGMMLVREFISMMRNTAATTAALNTTTTNNNNRERERARAIEVTESAALSVSTNATSTDSSTASTASTASNNIRSPLSNEATIVSNSSPIRRHSELNRHTTQSPSGNFWLDQVHPKEYRNYLKRRDLQRSLIEAEEIRSFTSQYDDFTISNVTESDSLMLPDDHASNVSGTSTMRTNFTTTSASTTANGGESFRCRICSSSTCCNKDHVVQASRIRNFRTAQRNQSVLQISIQESNEAISNESNSNASDPIANENRNTPPTAAPIVTNNTNITTNTANTTNNTNFENTWNLDDVEDLSFPEFFGFTLQGTPLLELLQNAAIVVGCNTLAMHLFLFVPFVTGRAVVSGTLLRVSLQVIQAVAMYFLKPETIESLSSIIKLNLEIFSKYSIPFTSAKETSFLAFVFQLSFGYGLICSIFSVYLKYTSRLTDSFHRIFVPVTSFIGIFIKLISLLFIEIAAFPLACGFMVDFASLSLFPHSSVTSRLEGFKVVPISSLTVHWALGAFFMISFASLVTFLRSYLRPGLLFFLRNPLDPDNHPVKEMVDRGFLNQIYRLFISLIFYALLIASSIGLCVKIVSLPMVSNVIFPLNLKFNDPLIEIPIDLLLHLLLRSLFKSLAPMKLFKSLIIKISKITFKSLNLSSYFLGGGRYLNEESFPKDGTWVAVPDFDKMYSQSRLREIRNHKVTPLEVSQLKVLIDKHGQPVLESSSNTDTSRSASTDWTVVFRPNFFKLKCFLVLITGIVLLQTFLVSILLVPLLTGRLLLNSFLSSEPKNVHEVYSWCLGSIVLLLILKTVELLIMPRKTPTSTSGNVHVSLLTKMKHVVSLSIKSTVLLLFIGIIWPLQVGILFALLVNPLLYNGNNNFINMISTNLPITDQQQTLSIIFFGSCWSLGFPLLKLLFTLRSHLPMIPRSTQLALSSLNTHSQLSNLNLKSFLLSIALPVTSILTFTLISPPIVSLVAVAMFPNNSPPTSTYNLAIKSQQSSHFYAFLAIFSFKLLKLSFKLVQNLITGIRDETYLVGRRLHNLENRNNNNNNNNTTSSNNPEIMSPLL